MSEDSMRRRLCSPAPTPAPAPVPLPDDDDLLQEILLRLPPRPSSLPRACLVCKRWRRLLSDPQFLRRFRAFHHREPPLLGFFIVDFGVPYFTPTLDPPDRVPPARLSLALPRDERWRFLGCRHGLGLLLDLTRLEVTVWDPITGDKRRVAVPPGFSNEGPNIVSQGALFCEDGLAAGCHHSRPFKVVLLRTDDWPSDEDPQAFASLYDSETNVWGDLISTSIKVPLGLMKPSILVGNSLCWSLLGYDSGGILEFDLDRKSLAAIKHPVNAHVVEDSCFQILRMEDSAIGLAISSGVSIQLWERKANSYDGTGWMLQKTIELDKFLSLRSPMDGSWTVIRGYDEDGHVIFVSVDHEVFMIQVKSMQFQKLFESNLFITYHPYRSVYTAGMGIGSGDIGFETLNNA